VTTPVLPAWIASMLPDGIERSMVDVGDGHRMHVMQLGRGRPVLMVHGNPTWGFLYRQVAAALAGDELRLVIPDLIGLGFSDKPRDPAAHRLEDHGRWLGALIDALDLRDLVFVGQDWGGPIGLRALADRPDRLAGMVVLNTVVGPPKPDFKPTAFHRFARVPLLSDAVFRLGRFPQVGLHLAQGDRRSIRGSVARAYRYPLRRVRDNVAPLALARMVPDTFSHPSIEPLRRCQALVEAFRGPTAIVWGDRDPILGSVRGWIEKLLPDAEVTRTTAGHFLQEEVPEPIAAAVRAVARRAAA
jgi:cis-3-alkyl-4-acyloxetan-2-one decarboxylase